MCPGQFSTFFIPPNPKNSDKCRKPSEKKIQYKYIGAEGSTKFTEYMGAKKGQVTSNLSM